MISEVSCSLVGQGGLWRFSQERAENKLRSLLSQTSLSMTEGLRLGLKGFCSLAGALFWTAELGR